MYNEKLTDFLPFLLLVPLLVYFMRAKSKKKWAIHGLLIVAGGLFGLYMFFGQADYSLGSVVLRAIAAGILAIGGMLLGSHAGLLAFRAIRGMQPATRVDTLLKTAGWVVQIMIYVIVITQAWSLVYLAVKHRTYGLVLHEGWMSKAANFVGGISTTYRQIALWIGSFALVTCLVLWVIRLVQRRIARKAKATAPTPAPAAAPAPAAPAAAAAPVPPPKGTGKPRRRWAEKPKPAAP